MVENQGMQVWIVTFTASKGPYIVRRTASWPDEERTLRAMSVVVWGFIVVMESSMDKEEELLYLLVMQEQKEHKRRWHISLSIPLSPLCHYHVTTVTFNEGSGMSDFLLTYFWLIDMMNIDCENLTQAVICWIDLLTPTRFHCVVQHRSGRNRTLISVFPLPWNPLPFW